MSVGSLSYRVGGEADIPQLKTLGLLAYGQHAAVLGPEHWATMQANLVNDNLYVQLLKKATCFVCINNEQLVGMAFLLPSGHPDEMVQAEWAYIRMVGVHPEFSGLGIAKKLMQFCMEEARKQQEKILALHTSEFMVAAQHIYKKLGFKLSHEIENRFGKRYWIFTLELQAL